MPEGMIGMLRVHLLDQICKNHLGRVEDIHNMAASGERIAAAGRLVLVAQTYFPAIDGTAVLMQHLAEQFAAGGDEVHVITTDALGPAGFRTRKAERTMAAPIEDIRGVRVHRLPTYWWLSSISRPVQAVGRRLRLPSAERIGDLYIGPLMRGFLGTLDELAPAAVYASSFPYWHMHQLVTWGQSHRVPVVLHGAIHPEDRWAFDRSSIRRSCSQAAGYAANTAYEARYVEGLGVPRDRITVVGIGVDVELLKVARAGRTEASGASSQKPRILYLGHLSVRKGLDTVVAALPTIWARHPSVEVVIAGKTTEDAHDLRRAAYQVSQGYDLHWLPDVTEAEKAALFASASMVLYPSCAESFGFVFLEAWSFGVPVVGCRAGAIPDVVEDGVTGLLMTPGDSMELANCVSRLIDDPGEAKRLGAEGQRRVGKKHTWTAVVHRARQALDAARTRMADQPVTGTPRP
jgi:glycosyltransferase involved in cell wall biosynthesis